MKDLEKIKSEDLACQVADANPGNFAIEQEVAQLVGATVPAPTEPSADDARELGAQLLVFLRRALTPIQTALRTALAAIYAHLDSRCTDYTPAAYASYLPLPSYDPMRPLTPRTLPNLLTALTAFSARKISNGSAPNDGIPDGTSLAHLLCDTSAANAVTEIKDDNYGWTMNKALTNLFPNVTKATLRCRKLLLADGVRFTTLPLEELNFPELEEMSVGTSTSTRGVFMGLQTKVLHFPVLSYMHNKKLYAGVGSYSVITGNQLLEEIIVGDETDGMLIEHDSLYGAGFITGESDSLPNLKYIYINAAKIRPPRQAFTPYLIHSVPATKVQFGTLTECSNFLFSGTSPNIIDLEFGQGTSCSLYLANWSPTNALDASMADLIEQRSTAENNLQQFLQNFKEHIALRLTSNGSGLTLTLSQAVFDTIWNQDGTPKSTDPDSVIYQINKIIKTDKHWSVNRA